jgi:hypothetical protein
VQVLVQVLPVLLVPQVLPVLLVPQVLEQEPPPFSDNQLPRSRKEPLLT